jgi:hypothetical protein
VCVGGGGSSRTGHLAIGHDEGVVYLGGLTDGPAGHPFPTNPAIFLDLSSGPLPHRDTGAAFVLAATGSSA